MTSKTNRPSISKSDKNWYSNDEISLIKKAAFDQGFEHFTQTYLEEFRKSITNVQEKVSSFFNKLKTEYPDIIINQIRLKPSSVNSFELIFIVPEADFIDESKQRSLFKKTDEFVDREFNDDLSVVFLYMPDSGTTNDDEFRLNGFCFTFDPTRKK